MGYWGTGLFENDTTMDWVDATAHKLSGHIAWTGEPPEIADLFSAAIFVRGIEAVALTERDGMLPITVFKLVQQWASVVKGLLPVFENSDPEFAEVLSRSYAVIKRIEEREAPRLAKFTKEVAE